MFEITKSLNPRRVLIRELHAEHVEKIRSHFKDLGNDDRLLRFGMHTTDEMIDKYVNSINFIRDAVFGVFDNNLNLIGCAHLGYPASNLTINSTVEFGVSVSEVGRGKGIGSALFKRAAIHARNTNIKVLYIHYLARNKVMMHIAKKAGMSIEYSFGEADAYLTLIPSSNTSIIAEAVQAQVADIDYAFKKNISHSKLFLLNIFSFALNK
jgi:RimJ/RimL family protein N-acetyltransferase